MVWVHVYQDLICNICTVILQKLTRLQKWCVASILTFGTLILCFISNNLYICQTKEDFPVILIPYMHILPDLLFFIYGDEYMYIAEKALSQSNYTIFYNIILFERYFINSVCIVFLLCILYLYRRRKTLNKRVNL